MSTVDPFDAPGLLPGAMCSPGVLEPSTTILQSLLDCMCCTLAANDAAVCCCAFEPGDQVAWDHCSGADCGGECEGQAYIKVDRIYPTKPFPFEDLIWATCDHRDLAMTVEMGVLRCTPTPSGRSSSVSPAAKTAAAFKAMRDIWLMRSAVQCCFLSESVASQKYYDLSDRTKIGGARTIGPEGGCQGTALRLTFRLSDACRCG